MELKYVHGRLLTLAANRYKDPIAKQVKSLWSSEGQRGSAAKRREIIRRIGWKEWRMLSSTRHVVGDEAYFIALYDALKKVPEEAFNNSLPTLPDDLGEGCYGMGLAA